MSGSKTLKRRQKQLIKAAYLTAVVASSIAIIPAQAQTTEWTANDVTNQWSEAENWDPQNVPGVPADNDDMALFSNRGSSATNVDVDVDAELPGIRFTQSTAYDLDLLPNTDLTLTGSGIENDSSELQTFNIGDGATLNFRNEAGVGGDNLTAINIASAGTLNLFDNSSGNHAVISNAGLVDVSGVSGNDNATQIGSLSGSGDVYLGGTELILGGLDRDDEISGDITDGANGGQLTKIGSGTLTLSGENEYSGNTNVNEGVLDIAAGGNLVNSHVVVDEDARLEVNGSASNGVTNFGTTNVNAGGYVEDNTGLINSGIANITGGYVFGEFGAENLETGVLNISGDAGSEQIGLLEGESIGLFNNGTTNVNDGGRIEGGFIGVINENSSGDEINLLNHEGEPGAVAPVALLNVNAGGEVEGGFIGVINHGVVNVNGGLINGGFVGVINGESGGLQSLSTEGDHELTIAILNVNDGGLVRGESNGVQNHGITNVNDGGEISADNTGVLNGNPSYDFPSIAVVIEGPQQNENTPVLNVNSGGGVSGGFIGVENYGTTNVNDGGRIRGDVVGVVNGSSAFQNEFTISFHDESSLDEGAFLNVEAGGSVFGGNTGLTNHGSARIDGSVEGDSLGAWNGGYLTGGGTIIGGLISDGILQPGAHDYDSQNRYAELTVQGDVEFREGSTFITNIRSSRNSRLFVTGEADLAGDVEAHVDSFGLRDTYEIVVTEEGLVDFNENGNFNDDVQVYLVDKNGNLTDAEDSIVGELSYDEFIAYLTLTRNTTNFSGGYGNLTRNQRALAQLLDGFYNGVFPELDEEDQEEFLERYNDFFAELFDGDVPQNLSDANGEGFTGLPVATQAAARRFMDRLLNQLQQQSSSDVKVASSKAPRLVYSGTRYAGLLAQATARPVYAGVNEDGGRSSGIWATIGRASDDVDSESNNAGFDVRATEYQIGYTRSVSPRTTLGLSIGKSDGRFDATDADAKGDTDTLSFGAALRHDSREWYATGGIAYNRHSIDSERRLGGFEYSGDTSGRTIELSGEIGKKIVSGQWRVEPNISLNLANTRIDGYDEDGGPGALDVGTGKFNTRRVGIGVRISSNNPTARFRPYVSAGYQREFGDRRVELNNTLAGIGSFEVEGTDLGRNIWKLRVGADARINDRLSIIGEIGGSWRDNNDSQYIFGGMKYGF